MTSFQWVWRDRIYIYIQWKHRWCCCSRPIVTSCKKWRGPERVAISICEVSFTWVKTRLPQKCHLGTVSIFQGGSLSPNFPFLCYCSSSAAQRGNGGHEYWKEILTVYLEHPHWDSWSLILTSDELQNAFRTEQGVWILSGVKRSVHRRHGREHHQSNRLFCRCTFMQTSKCHWVSHCVCFLCSVCTLRWL